MDTSISSPGHSAEHGEVPVTDGVIRYTATGSGRPIVFIHGFYVNSGLWRDVVPHLASDFRCITPDLPLGSHSVAMNAEADLTPPGVADKIAEFIAALDLEDVILVGNDSGGALCQMVVTRHPERVGALVLTPCDAFEKFPPFPYNLIGVIARLPGAISVVNALLGTKLGRWITFRPLLRRAYDDALVKTWTDPAGNDREIVRDARKFAVSVSSSYTKDAAQRLPEFEKPALIVWPPKCTFFKYSLAERLAATLPNARLVPIEDAWTFLPLDQPERLATAISEFVEASVAPAAREPARR